MGHMLFIQAGNTGNSFGSLKSLNMGILFSSVIFLGETDS